MFENVIMLLISICLVVGACWLVIWVLGQLGVSLPEQVIKIFWVIVVLIVILLLYRAFSPMLAGRLGSLLISPAAAHDQNRPELNEWFRGLQSTAGASCCDGSEAFSVLDPEWDVVNDLEYPFKVKYSGLWLRVPKGSVVKGPNKAGPAQLWPTMDEDGGEPGVRCFLPGAGT